MPCANAPAIHANGAPIAPLSCLGGALAAAPLCFVARAFRDGTRDGQILIEFQRRRGNSVIFQRLFGALARSAALSAVVVPRATTCAAAHAVACSSVRPL